MVETVDYQPWEVGNFPPPTNPTEVGARILIQRRQEETGGKDAAAPAKADSDSEEDEEDEEGEKEGADTQVLLQSWTFPNRGFVFIRFSLTPYFPVF